ncbi:MAG: hypothetical protein KGL90_10605 [Burkholderiales bacterium]|nr:hypothetical protein [Burkholderiales bacterium]
MKLLRLCAHQIRLNEKLPWNVRSEPGTLLLGKGFLVTSQAQINTLLDRGVYVDQEEYKEHQRTVQVTQRVDPFHLWSLIFKRTAILLHDPLSNPNFLADLASLSDMFQKTLRMDVDAGTFAMVHADTHNYAVEHSVQTAFVCTLVAQRFGWSEADRSTLLSAALTMNIAILDLQNVLQRQSEPLTPQQRLDIDNHPIQGRALLEQSGITNEDWLRTVEDHHIALDSTIMGKRHSPVSQVACIIHHADIYLAKISARTSRPAFAVNVAARDMFMEGGSDNPFTAGIIKEVGIYPPGTFVKLANGDTAIVVRRGDTASTPKVNSLVGADGWVFPDSLPRDTSKPEYKIVAPVPRSDVMLSLSPLKLFGYTD